MRGVVVLMVGALAAFGTGPALARAPAPYLEKIRCLAAFEAAAATLEPDENNPSANTPNRDGGEPREFTALRERLDGAGEQFVRDVDATRDLTDGDREEGDRAYEQESERLFTMLENARDARAMDRAFQTLKGQVDRCFSLAGR